MLLELAQSIPRTLWAFLRLWPELNAQMLGAEQRGGVERGAALAAAEVAGGFAELGDVATGGLAVDVVVAAVAVHPDSAEVGRGHERRSQAMTRPARRQKREAIQSISRCTGSPWRSSTGRSPHKRSSSPRSSGRRSYQPHNCRASRATRVEFSNARLADERSEPVEVAKDDAWWMNALVATANNRSPGCGRDIGYACLVVHSSRHDDA